MNRKTLAVVSAALLLSATSMAEQQPLPAGMQHYVFTYNFAVQRDPMTQVIDHSLQHMDYQLALDIQYQVNTNLALLVTEDAMQTPAQLLNNGLRLVENSAAPAAPFDE